MPINFMGIFSKKTGHGAKNTVDRAVDLCYNKTIERQGTGRHEKWRHEKWRAKKMIAFVFFGAVLIAPVLVGAFFGISCLYEYTIKLVYECGYNKNRENKRNFNISDYEDYAALSVLALLAYLTVLIHISTLFWNTLVVTLPMTVTVFAVWAVINYAVFYKLGCKNGNKELVV